MFENRSMSEWWQAWKEKDVSNTKAHTQAHTQTQVPTIYMTWLCVEVSGPAGVGLRLVIEWGGEFVGQTQFGELMLEYWDVNILLTTSVFWPQERGKWKGGESRRKAKNYSLNYENANQRVHILQPWQFSETNKTLSSPIRREEVWEQRFWKSPGGGGEGCSPASGAWPDWLLVNPHQTPMPTDHKQFKAFLNTST